MVTVPTRSYGANLDGHDGTSLATVDISAMALRESTVIRMAELVRNSFQGFRGLQSGLAILRCFLDDEADDASQPIDGSDQWVYEVTLSYVIKHRVSMPVGVTQTNV